MAEKVIRKAAKAEEKKGSPKGGKHHAEEAVNGINRIIETLNSVADVVAIKGRPNNYRFFCKGKSHEKGSTTGKNRANWLGELRPYRGKINLGLNSIADNGKQFSFLKMKTNFGKCLASYEVTEKDSIVSAAKKVCSILAEKASEKKVEKKVEKKADKE